MVPEGSELFFSKEYINISNIANSGLARSVNRASSILIQTSLNIPQVVKSYISQNTDEVAFYLVVDQTSQNHEQVLAFIKEMNVDKAGSYSKLFSPRYIFQTSIGLVSSSLSIFLGIKGGVSTYTHSRNGHIHALRQAAIDLNNGTIKYAIIGGVFSLEDEIIIHKYKKMFGINHLTEGAFLIGTTSSEDLESIVSDLNSQLISNYTHGPLSAVMEYLKEVK